MTKGQESVPFLAQASKPHRLLGCIDTYSKLKSVASSFEKAYCVLFITDVGAVVSCRCSKSCKAF